MVARPIHRQNVTGEGKLSLLRNGMIANYKEIPFASGYVDGAQCLWRYQFSNNVSDGDADPPRTNQFVTLNFIFVM